MTCLPRTPPTCSAAWAASSAAKTAGAGWPRCADASTKRAMLAAARRIILVVAGEKFALSAMAVACGLADVVVLVADASAPADTLERLRGAGMQIVVVSA